MCNMSSDNAVTCFIDNAEPAATQLMYMHFLHISIVFMSLCVPLALLRLGPT